MLVESDILVRGPLADYLRECGYRVLEACGADEAHTHLARADHAIEVVLIDANAAYEGGFALASWVRAHHPGSAVILAGNATRAVEKAADLCEEGPPISKPYDHQLVLERIRWMMAARARIAAAE